MEAEQNSDNSNMDSQLTNNPIQLHRISEYFRAFNEKDINVLADLYGEEVILKDWTGKWDGKYSVLSANKELFQSQPNLKITLNRIENKSNTSYCYISILLENTKLEVLDCIYFNEEGEISYIEAILRDTTDLTPSVDWMNEEGI
jgi:hypothetical protein